MRFGLAPLMAVLLMLAGIGCAPVGHEEATVALDQGCSVDPSSSSAGAAARGVVFLVLASFIALAERRRNAAAATRRI
jgi:hypothetical protein